MTTYILQREFTIEMWEKTYNVRIYKVYEKFANVPSYECYIDNVPSIRRWSRIAKRDVENYIYRYL